MGGITTSQSFAHRAASEAHNRCPQLVFPRSILFIDFVFDRLPRLRRHRPTLSFALPRGFVKEDVLTKILGFDKPKIALRSNELDAPKPLTLNVKRLSFRGISIGFQFDVTTELRADGGQMPKHG